MLTSLKPTDIVRSLPEYEGQMICVVVTSRLPRMLYVLVPRQEKSTLCV
jgi:hypothetical protein